MQFRVRLVYFYILHSRQWLIKVYCRQCYRVTASWFLTSASFSTNLRDRASCRTDKVEILIFSDRLYLLSFNYSSSGTGGDESDPALTMNGGDLGRNTDTEIHIQISTKPITVILPEHRLPSKINQTGEGVEILLSSRLEEEIFT